MNKNISNRIPPNYSTWQTIEHSYNFAKEMIDTGIEGDFVECGVAAGNNLAAMCAAGRHGYGFDSFEGIPWAGEHDDIQPGMSEKPKIMEGISSGITVHTQENVELDMKKWGITNYTLISGWFKDTIPAFIEVLNGTPFKISVLRLDGDLYESTLIPLIHFYPLLSKGGVLIMDDWNLAGCRKAFDDYFTGFRLPKPTLIIDDVVTYWKK